MLHGVTFKFVFKMVLYVCLSILGVHLIGAALYILVYFLPFGYISHLMK